MAEKAGRIARKEGAKWLCGGHIAHWHEWDEQEYYPNWDQSLGITTTEGYLQLKLYLTKWHEIIRKNNWLSCMTQALADEPQTHNDSTYRILAGIFRKFLPGIPIIDAVETTHLEAALTSGFQSRTLMKNGARNLKNFRQQEKPCGFTPALFQQVRS